MKRIIFFLSLSLSFGLLNAQSYNHWNHSFNETSSLVSGAVVGGGSGPSSIYYNPASISEITGSKLSIHMSLSSIRIVNLKNALGNGIDMDKTEILTQPRSISFMIEPKNNPNWSFEIATLNTENYLLDIMGSVDMKTDVLANLPGEERYYALYQYYNRFRDNWFGIGSSLKVSQSISLGLSMFAAIKSVEYRNEQSIEAYPLDSVNISNQYLPFYTASYQSLEYVKYNDYRLVWKFGILYKKKRYSLGLCLTTPSVGGIYSDGKRVTKNQSQANITDPESGLPLPDYFNGDYQEKKEVKVNHKTPFSIAAGLTWYIHDNKKVIYTTVEYFGGLEPYKLIEANESQNFAEGFPTGSNIPFNEWLTYVSGAKPVLNAALGYSWKIKESIEMMAGFRTDFNYRKDYDYYPYSEKLVMKGLELDYYHLSGGFAFTVLKQEIIAGIQYSIGVQKNMKQFANLSDPIEYNQVDNVPLQGLRENTMDAKVNTVFLYFGATFNFGGDK